MQVDVCRAGVIIIFRRFAHAGFTVKGFFPIQADMCRTGANFSFKRFARAGFTVNKGYAPMQAGMRRTGVIFSFRRFAHPGLTVEGFFLCKQTCAELALINFLLGASRICGLRSSVFLRADKRGQNWR